MSALETQVLQGNPTPKVAEAMPGGFVLFDRQVKSFQAYLAFQSGPDMQAVRDQLASLNEMSTQIPLRPKEQAHLPSEELQVTKQETWSAKHLSTRLAQALSQSSVVILVPGGTEIQAMVFPKNHSEKAKAKELKAKADLEQVQINKQVAEERARARSLEDGFLFSDLERTLFYALTHLSTNEKARGSFLNRYARVTHSDPDHVLRQYALLAAKAAPSLHKDVQVTYQSQPHAEQIIDVAPINTQEIVEPTTAFVPNVEESQVAELEKPQRNVVIHVNGVNKLLSELTDSEFIKLFSRSGTPIKLDNLRRIINELAAAVDPLGMYQRHPKTVQGGEYKGFHVVGVGKKGRILFSYENDSVHVRFGDYFGVYKSGNGHSGRDR